MTTSTEAHQPAPSGRAETRRAIWNTIRGSSGNLVEWYDVYVYTVFATYFEAQFFDKADKNATVYVYAIFAVTFLTRPIGSWFFGRFADRRGRRAALTFSVSLMALCSLVIALVPSRETIGVAAPIILILCRLVQGFATGGEYGTSATYMSEAATRGTARLLLVVPVRDAGRRTRTGAVHPADHPDHVQYRAGPRIRLAHRLCHRRRGRDRGVLAAAHHGRIAVPRTAGSHQGRQGQELRVTEELLNRYWKPLLLVLPDHHGRHPGVLRLQRQRPGHRQDHLQGPGHDGHLDQPHRIDLPDGHPTAGRHDQRQGRPQTPAAVVRHRRGDLHLCAVHLSAPDTSHRSCRSCWSPSAT